MPAEVYQLGLSFANLAGFEADARTAKALIQDFESTIRSLSASQGGRIGAAGNTEFASSLGLDTQLNKLKAVRAEMEKFQAANQELLKYQAYTPRTNVGGETNAQDLATQARYKAAAIEAAGSEEKFATATVQANRIATEAQNEIAGSARRLATLQRASVARYEAENARGTPNFIAANALTPEQVAAYRQPLTQVGSADSERASVALARAQSELTANLAKQTQVGEKSYAGQLTSAQATEQLGALQRQLTGIMERRAIAEERLVADEGGLSGQFARGFRGGSDRPYAEQIGQAVKFSVFYGVAYRALSELTNVLHESLTQGIAFEQGLADMSIATGRPRDGLVNLGNQLAEISAAAGASPAAGLEIGARSIGLYGAIQAPAAQQDLIATTSAAVVSKITLGTKDDPVKVGEGLAAITQALGIGASGQLKIADLDAYYSKRFGVHQGSTITAGAESATVGTAAGFSIEQIQAIAGVIIARTGQDPVAVGGYLAQIFSRGGRTQVDTVASRYGIETTGRSFQAVFGDLAKAYKGASASDREVIAGAFGRGGKIENAVTALFRNYGTVGTAVRDAQAGKADGSLDKTFQLRLQTIGGEIAVLSGHFKEFALLIGESGLLDSLGLVVKALDTFLGSVNSILVAFDQLPHAIRLVIELLGAGLLANKFGAFSGIVSTYQGGASGGVAAASVLAGGEEIAAAEATVAASIVAASSALDAAVAAQAAGLAGGTGEVLAATTALAEAIVAGGVEIAAAEAAAALEIATGGVGGALAGAGAGAVAGVGGAEVGVLGAEAGVAVGSVGAGLGAVGAAALSTLGPIALAVGGIYTLGAAISTFRKQTEARQAANQAINGPEAPGYGATPLAYRAQATLLDSIATQNRQATNGFINLITGGHANDSADALAKQLNSDADRLRAIADHAAKIEAANTPAQSAFQSLDPTDITKGLNDITTQGGSAVTQLDALRTAIFGLGEQAKKTRGTIDVGELAVAVIGDLHKHTDSGFNVFTPPRVTGGRGATGVYASTPGAGISGAPSGFIDSLVQRQLGLATVQDRTAAALKERGITSFGQLTPAQLASVAAEVTKIKPENNRGGPSLTPASFTKLQAVLTANYVKTATAAAKNFDDAINGTSGLSTASATALGAQLTTTLAARSALRPATDYSGRLGDARVAIKGIRNLINRRIDNNDPAQLKVELDQANAAFVQVQIDHLEALRKVAISNSSTQAQASARGLAIVHQEINAIVHNGGSADQLAAVMATAGKGAIAIARDTIQKAITAAKIAAEVQAEIAAAAATMNSVLNTVLGLLPGGGSAPAPTTPTPKGPSVKHLQSLLNSLNFQVPNLNADKLPTATGALAETAAERAAAAQAAQALKKGGAIASAQAAISSAEVAMQKAKKGSVAYFVALGSFYQAQDALNTALFDYRKILDNLKIDQTNPVAVANLALVEARRKLASDRSRGKGRDVLAQDQLDVKNAQTSAESAAFTQRLSDVQTADQLGRISHGAYLAYLESEHNRLAAIAKKTRQQRDELDQIDQLIKSANQSLSGAFNIGDIKLPTPYEVRRYIKTQVQSTQFALGGSAQTSPTTIYINGADTAAVKKIITDTVGRGATVLTSTSRRT